MKAILEIEKVPDFYRTYVEFVQTIDFAELCEKAMGYLNIKIPFKQPKICKVISKPYLKLESEDLTANSGVFANVLEKCKIESYADRFTFDKKLNEKQLRVEMTLSYGSKGVSNASGICNACYGENSGWTFENICENQVL